MRGYHSMQYQYMQKNVQNNMLYVEQIAEDLINEHAVVMVGAGFSKNAIKAKNTPDSPSWNELANEFYKKLYGKLPQETFAEKHSPDVFYMNPLDLAEEVEAAYGRLALDQMLQEMIPDLQLQPSELHRKLLRLPWKDIFTTNYDTLLERTTKQIVEKRFNVVTMPSELVNSRDAARIIKLHGSFPSGKPFVISQEDYRVYPEKFAPFVNTVQQALLENTLCLVGFSGTDLNFQKWIGWIHDNLGEKNSPMIYLITGSNSGFAKKILMNRKNIIEVNIKEAFGKENYQEAMGALLDYLETKYKSNQERLQWEEKRILNEKAENLKARAGQLQRVHESYPGWLTLPSAHRKEISYFLMGENLYFEEIKENEATEGEKEYLIEFYWFCQIALSDEAMNYQKKYEWVALRNPDCVPLMLILLSFYRETGEKERWKDTRDRLEKRKKALTAEERHEFYYEVALYEKLYLQFAELEKVLNQWKVSERDFLWVQRKAGLLAQLGFPEESDSMLGNSLQQIRMELQGAPLDYELLSLENAMSSLRRYIRQAMRVWKPADDSKEIEDSSLWKESQVKYDCVWGSENERFRSYLDNYKPLPRTWTEQCFDLHRKSYNMGESSDQEVVAYGFLKFRELTGYPFKIGNFINGTQAAQKAVAIEKDYLTLSQRVMIFAECNVTKEESLDLLMDRKALSECSQEEADQYVEEYLNILDSTEQMLGNEASYFPRNIKEYTLKLLPELLGRLTSKCSDAKLEEILKWVLNVYHNEKRCRFGNMIQLESRLMNALSAKQQKQYLSEIVRTPVFSLNSRDAHEFKELCGLLKKNQDTETVITNSDFHALLYMDCTDMQKEALKIRMLYLYEKGYLSEKQRKQLIPFLWEDKKSFPVYVHFYPSIYGKLCPEDVEYQELYREKLRKAIQSYDYSSNTRTYPERLPMELNMSIKDQIWVDSEDLQMVFQTLCRLHEKYSVQLRNYQKSLCDKFEIEMCMNDLKVVIRSLEYLAIKKYPGRLPENTDISPLLQYLWSEERDGGRLIQDLTEGVLQTNKLIRGYAYQDFYLIFNHGLSEMLLVKEERKELIGRLIDMVYFRSCGQEERLLSALTFAVKQGELDDLETKVSEKLLRSLEHLGTCTKENGEFQTERLKLLEAASELACALYTRIYDRYHELLPKIIAQWKEVGENPGEFLEIRMPWRNRI